MFLTQKRFVVGVISFFALGAMFVLGVFLGFNNRPAVSSITSLVNKESEVPSEKKVDFSPFWETWKIVDEKYVSEDGPQNQEKVWGAIQGLVSSLGDPYSVFLPPAETEMFESDISGNFEGVGMEIGIRDKILTVIAPLKDTPAEKAGVLSGDKIIKIDETSTVDLNVDKAIRLIRGKKGTAVKLSIIRGPKDEPVEISIVRDVISIPTIDTEIKSSKTADTGPSEDSSKNQVFVIRLYNFSANSPYLFRDSLREFANSGKDKLIIDLRGNPGGYLEAAVDMASWFLPAGKVIVREDFGKKAEPVVYRSKGYDVFNENLKMVILINGGTASASEILAGALSEHGKAKLVGEKTFGKGSVQELVKVASDSSLKITVARWLTPNGMSISKNGLKPDVEVAITKEDLESKLDPQMDKAIAILTAEK